MAKYDLFDNSVFDDTSSSFRVKTPDTDRLAQRRAELRRKQKEKRRKSSIIAILVIAVTVIVITVICVAAGSGSNPQPSEAVPVVATAVSSKQPTQQPTQAPPTMSVPTSSNGQIPQAIDASSNDLLDIIMEGKGSHVAYLTFDDGPNDTITPQILDVLKEYDVKATFFQVGYLIESFPDMTKRAVDEGHFIANHSYSHDYDAFYASEESLMSELNKTYELIKSYYPADNPPMRLMRYPGGSYDSDENGPKQAYKTTLKENNYYFVDWNCLNGDAEGDNKNADQLYQYLLSNITTNNIVILMHDTQTKEETVKCLPKVLDYLIENKWVFKTLDQIPYNPSNEVPTTSTAESDNVDDVIDTDNSDNTSDYQ